MGFVVGQANGMGEAVPVGSARERVFGVALLNDWSARDVQAWEYQPLGPFLGKSFATSLSAWITPLEALEAFQVPARKRDTGEPAPLGYLLDEADQRSGGLDVGVEVLLSTERMRREGAAAEAVSRGATAGLYWTAAQMVAHAASNGCPLEVGDVLATGTISGAERTSAGCLMELTRNGAEPVVLANGESRAWLEDGDDVTLRASCEREGLPKIVLGECVGRVVAARV
jgi:fumarylacetoacetase